MCCSPIEYDPSEINGVCEKCETPTVDGVAAEGCSYSPVECQECGWSPCDLSC